jgi:hypothetical protein
MRNATRHFILGLDKEFSRFQESEYADESFASHKTVVSGTGNTCRSALSEHFGFRAA